MSGDVATPVMRFWMADDQAILYPMIADFLTANFDRGGDIKANERNVNQLLGIGLAWAERRCPTLLAFVDGEPVGYCEWGWDEPTVLDLRWKTCLCFGTYVTPTYRGHGVARALRAQARAIGEAAGVERFIGPVHLTNPLSVVDLADHGWWPTAVTMELHV